MQVIKTGHDDQKNIFADHRSWQDVVLADRETVTSGPGTTLAQLEGFPEQYSEQKEKIYR